jgi:hypothetical protein
MLTGNSDTTEVFLGSQSCSYEACGGARRKTENGEGNQEREGNRREYAKHTLCVLDSTLTGNSDQKSARRRYCGYVDENVLEVPTFNVTN